MRLMMVMRVVVLGICVMSGVSAFGQEAVESVVEFLGVEEGRVVIGDEGAGFFGGMQRLAIGGFTGVDVSGMSLEEARAEARRVITAGVLEFDERERETLRWYVERMHEELGGDYPILTAGAWRFIKLRTDLVGGLPHTRGDCIVLNGMVLDTMSRMRETLEGEAADVGAVLAGRLMGLLVHEKMHVIQRLEPWRFDEFYKEEWDFERMEILGGEAVMERAISNPDGLDVDWVRRLRHNGQAFYVWPLMLFGGEGDDVRFPEDAVMEGISVEPLAGRAGVVRVMHDDDGSVLSTDLRIVGPYLLAIPARRSVYHPHEIMAEGVENLLVLTRFGPVEMAIDEIPEESRGVFEAVEGWLKSQEVGAGVGG